MFRSLVYNICHISDIERLNVRMGYNVCFIVLDRKFWLVRQFRPFRRLAFDTVFSRFSPSRCNGQSLKRGSFFVAVAIAL